MAEKQSKDYINLRNNIISYDDFFKLEDSSNLKLLMELSELNSKSINLGRNKDVLYTIYKKLTTYDEQKVKYETIMNENEEIQEIYIKRFELFKLIKTDKFDSKSEYKKRKDKYLQVKQYMEKAYQISKFLSLYYQKTFEKEIEKINSIYKDYSNKENKVNKWIYKKDDLINFIKIYKNKGNITQKIKEIKLFQLIYTDFTEGTEIMRLKKAKELIDRCKVIFKDIHKGNRDILENWQKKYKNEIDKDLIKLKDYYKIDNKVDLDIVSKNILIFTKKNIYYSDINSILYFFKLFNSYETNLSKFLKKKQLELKNKKDLDFEKLVNINNYLEEKQIYINNGKDFSLLIKFIRLFYNKENEINFVKKNDLDSPVVLLYRLNSTTDSLKFKDILEYQTCIDFINDIKNKTSDEKLLIKIRENINKKDINQLFSIFENYLKNFESLKSLDSNFDSSKDIYENIKYILNNSKFKFEFFKRELKVYDDNKKEKDIITKDLDGLIQLKDKINLNFEGLPYKFTKRLKIELKNKSNKIKIFIRYVEHLQCINKYFKNLENKGCPFLINIIVTISKDKIEYKLANEYLSYNELISRLKEYYHAILEYQLKFYKKNEYFRYVYDKQLYKLYKRIIHKNKDISSYIRFFINGDSIKDDAPIHKSQFNDIFQCYKKYRKAIEESYKLISNYIKNIFEINNTSLNKLYNNIKVKNNFHGIYKCNIKLYNIDLFITKMFFKLTGTFPIAQNILFANNGTSTGEIYSFIYRATQCRFNTLFIISISDNCSIFHLNLMTSLLSQIIREMKSRNSIKEIKDIRPCILFIAQNELGSSRRTLDFQEINDLPEYLKGDENKLEYSLRGNIYLEKEIYDAVGVYSSDCCGLGKTYLIRKEIKEKGENYHYFGIGGEIIKEELFKKLKKLLKYKINVKSNVGIHLDLYYTKNILQMEEFLFAMLITKIYQVNNKILHIPKNINIYVEIPNGPFQFLDDFPILTIFKRININLDNQLPLDIINDNLLQNLILKENENSMTYIEKKIYLTIINYLNSNKKEEIIKYNEKIKSIYYYNTKCVYSKKIKEKDVSLKNKTQKEKRDYIFNFFDFDEVDALKIQYEDPLIFKTKNGYIEIDISDKEVKGKDIKYFLSNLKKVMSLNESIEEIENKMGTYKITEDNYKKMILILFKIFANIPVIFMGETGCGKTELIKQLMKILNKDEENNNFIIKNIHSGIKENEIIEIIEKGEKNLEESKDDIICIFFDDINTTSLLLKMKEIFVNHSLNGKKIDERIRFIGSCNPLRRNKNNEYKEGLQFENNKEEEMVYFVNPLPNSMLNYIFYFKNLDNEDIKNYIENIISDEFPKGEKEDSENSILRKIAIDTIYNSHKFIEKKNGISSVSLRDFQRFKKTYRFFNEYYKNKNEFLMSIGEKIFDKIEKKTKIQSLVMSLFINYYIKIFKYAYKHLYLQEINYSITKLSKKFQIKEWLDNIYLMYDPFYYIIKEEEDFLLEQMEIKKEKGICLNNSLRENILLMFFSIYSQIPLIVVGKPDSSKSLSIQLIIRYMRGEYSNSNFLKKYPAINVTYFYESEMNTPESIENIIKEAQKKIDLIDYNQKVISLLVFDNLDLSEKCPTNCLKGLHSKLEILLEQEEKKRISFIGLSNWRLDPVKMNLAAFLAIPDFKLDDIKLNIETMANSYNKGIYNKYSKQYKLLGKIYFNYKEYLKKDLKDESYSNFDGERNFYNLIKIFSNEMIKYNMTDDPYIIDMGVQKALARNLYNLEINRESILKEYVKDINIDNLRTMDLIKDNILSKDSRFLLLVSEKAMFSFLIDIIIKEIEEINTSFYNKKMNYMTYIGSPFKGDRMNTSYQTEMIVNIENDVAEGKIIILSDLDEIYPILYDLFDQKYIVKDGKKYCLIPHGDNIPKLAFVNKNSKFIILIDKNHSTEQKSPFLDRFEKYIITFYNLLDEKDREKSQTIKNILKKLVSVKDINYNLDNILVNTNDDIIDGYIYLYKDRKKNSYKDIIKDKIIPILSQDIISTLHLSDLSNEERELYSLKNDIYSSVKYNSLDKYLCNDKRGKENILIVYSFSKVGEEITLSKKENYMVRIISEINDIFNFKYILNEFYEIIKYKSLILKFDSENAKYINFFILEINNYKKLHKIKDYNKKYIFTINIQREFSLEKKNNKITTVLIADENIKQLFIDDINGVDLSIKNIEKQNIFDFIKKVNLDLKKLIVEEILNFYRENKCEEIGKCKGIDKNNFIKEFENVIENAEEIINDIKRIIISKIDGNEKIIDLIIKNKYINQNTIAFIPAIITYIKTIFNEKIKILLRKTECNNFFTTIFMLNVKDEAKNSVFTTSSNQSNDYSFNINDRDILNNKLIHKIKNEFLKMLKEDINDINKHTSINIKINYKIPGFFNIYQDIKEYIEKEKLSMVYRQDETELRNLKKCQNELVSQSIIKLRNDVKIFNEKLYKELESKPLINKVIEAKISDKNYIDFIEIFLNDYITFYLEKLYNNKVNHFVINDVPHKIILLLLELKFKKLKEEEIYEKPLQNIIAKILWLEAYSKYIKKIIDLYNIISENILYKEKDKEFFYLKKY